MQDRQPIVNAIEPPIDQLGGIERMGVIYRAGQRNAMLHNELPPPNRTG
jgi:hypothetical protein